ncbi:hypothetical protein F5Y06DRAFT_71002 [Hypoxylon sp. FL0890]|nr:hypothetical protein F5Y06DRAFT_71002 [Hypoxylon sp. FL0890]
MAGQQIIKVYNGALPKVRHLRRSLLKWFREVHIPNGVPLMKKHGIIKYAVHTRLPEVAAASEADLKKAISSWENSQADLVLEYWLPEMEYLRNLVADPDWTEKTVKGQEDWIDMSRSTVRIE